jgi:thiol-disulfide isomerase/thioredoxin
MIYLSGFFLLLSMIVPTNVVGLESAPVRKRVLLDFTAAWCPSCRQMKLVWNDKEVQEALAKNQIEFREIDIDRDQQSGTMWKVGSIPCYILIELDKNGKGIELKRFVGAKPKSFILGWLNDA